MNKKSLKKALFAAIAAAAFSFEIYTAVPDKITLIEGRSYNLPPVISGLSKTTSHLKLLGIFPYKTVDVSVISDEELILSGETVGIKINADGVLVLGLADIKTKDGNACPAASAGLTSGDLIKEINGQQVKSVAELEQKTAENDKCTILFERDGELKTTEAVPEISTDDGTKKLGVWVRGSTTGIGTMTYIAPSDGRFGALGHSITDADTGQLIKAGNGQLLPAAVTGVTKGRIGLPGEIRGTVSSGKGLGSVDINTEYGVFGNIDEIPGGQKIPIASKDELQTGSAYIVSDVAGGAPVMYSAEIQHININADNNKGMVIKVTDDRLLNLTGGIIQGMSGSPIVQNGKLASAVTHVFVNDPSRGYGVFIENMLTQ